MTPDTFRRLAAQREGIHLDFKEQFYTNDEVGSGELSRNVMAMANLLPLHSGLKAHILFGVKEDPKDKTGIIVGFAPEPWMQSQNIQQKANSNISRTLKFTWSMLEVDGKSVAAIEIEPGMRPYCALRDKGRIKKNIAYVRVGDTTEAAPPDNIVDWARQDGIAAHDEERLMLIPRIQANGNVKSASRRQWSFHLCNDGYAAFVPVDTVLVWRVDDEKMFELCVRRHHRWLKGKARVFEDRSVQFPRRTVYEKSSVELSFSREATQLDVVYNIARDCFESHALRDIEPLLLSALECELMVTCESFDGSRRVTASLQFPWNSE